MTLSPGGNDVQWLVTHTPLPGETQPLSSVEKVDIDRGGMDYTYKDCSGISVNVNSWV